MSHVEAGIAIAALPALVGMLILERWRRQMVREWRRAEARALRQREAWEAVRQLDRAA